MHEVGNAAELTAVHKCEMTSAIAATCVLVALSYPFFHHDRKGKCLIYTLSKPVLGKH